MQNSQQVTYGRNKKLQLEGSDYSHDDGNNETVGNGLEYRNASNGSVSALMLRQPMQQTTLTGFAF
jgi:hypothetical protein